MSAPSTTTGVKPVSVMSFKNLERFTTVAKKQTATPATAGRILQVFLNVDMRMAHDGLDEFSRHRSVDVSSLSAGQYVVFVNTSKDRIKVYASNNVVAYKRLKKGQSFDLRVIQEIPRAFNANGALDMDKAIEDALKASLSRRSARVSLGV